MASDTDTARKLLGPQPHDQDDGEYAAHLKLIASALRKERRMGERTGLIRAMAVLRNELDKPQNEPATNGAINAERPSA